MPIRHGGMLASRASIWPRGAALIEPDDVERILANIDVHGGNGRD